MRRSRVDLSVLVMRALTYQTICFLLNCICHCLEDICLEAYITEDNLIRVRYFVFSLSIQLVQWLVHHSEVHWIVQTVVVVS